MITMFSLDQAKAIGIELFGRGSESNQLQLSAASNSLINNCFFADSPVDCLGC